MDFTTVIDVRDIKVGDKIPPTDVEVLTVDDDFRNWRDGTWIAVWTSEPRAQHDGWNDGNNYDRPDAIFTPGAKICVVRKAFG